MCIYLFVCLFAVVKIHVYVLIGSTRALSLFSVLECDVYVQLKKGNEITEHISAA